VCEGDQDGDKILDNEDASPFNKKISNRAANFHQFQIVALRVPPYKESEWIVLDEGTKIRQNKNSDATAAIGLQAFGSVNFEGRLQVSLTTIDDDFVGFAFAFQSHSNFYVMTWKRHVFLGQPNRPPLGRAGVAIKKVQSNTGASKKLHDALWHPNTKQGQVNVLWHDPEERAWKPGVWYTWKLKHRPAKGLIK
jgi:hypothetical protein